MLGTLERKRLLKEQVALRRLYHCHPTVLGKPGLDQNVETFEPISTKNNNKKQERESLLPRRNMRPNTSLYSDFKFWNSYPGVSRQNSKRTSAISSTRRSKSADGGAESLQSYSLCSGKQIHPRNGAVSAPPVLNANLFENNKGKKLLRKRAAHSASNLPVSGLRTDEQEVVKEEMKNKNNENMEASILMFNRWGCRKPDKRGNIKSALKNCWLVGTHGSGLCISIQQMNIYDYDIKTAPMKIKKSDKISVKNLSNKIHENQMPLPPNPSPSLENEIIKPRADENNNSSNDVSGSNEMKNEDDRVIIPGRNLNQIKLEIVINPPEDASDGCEENIYMNEQSDSDCLSPFSESSVLDFELHLKAQALPKAQNVQKVKDFPVETMDHTVQSRRSSKGSDVLEDILEVEDECDVDEVTTW